MVLDISDLCEEIKADSIDKVITPVCFVSCVLNYLFDSDFVHFLFYILSLLTFDNRIKCGPNEQKQSVHVI